MALHAATSFLAGFACRSQCGPIPCHAELTSRASRPFKLSLYLHSARLYELGAGPGLLQDQRPFVRVAIGDKTKETELGDWVKESNTWRFREVLTFEVSPGDDITVFLCCSTRYDLWVASLALTSRCVGEVRFPVSAALQRLRLEDCDTEGIFYVTPMMQLETASSGRNMGQVLMSFRTMQPPPHKAGHLERWCGTEGASYTTAEEDTDVEDHPCRLSVHAERGPGVRTVGVAWNDMH